MADDILITRIDEPIYTKLYKVSGPLLCGHKADIYAECQENLNSEGENDYYLLSFYLSADDYGTRDHIVGIPFGHPRRTCNYGLTEKGLQALRDVADPSLPHSYAWFVMTDCNTPQEQLHRNLTLDEAVELYQNSDHPEKRLGVTKDDFATVDFVRMVDGEQTFFGDYQKLESFKNDPTIFEAVEQLHQELEDMSQDQGMTM